MLRELTLKNFVLFESLRLEWAKGLNVLTGETGAGKSIVLDALGLLAGDRFSANAVRQGAERASVDGIFSTPRSRAFLRWWKDHDYEPTDELLIRREGLPDGRSKALLNDRPVTLATLQELGTFLIDLHGQNDHQQIMQPAVQRQLLDRFAGLEDTVDALAPLYERWAHLRARLSEQRLSEEERLQRIDLLQYQCSEIEKAKLLPEEEVDLERRLPELKNAEKLRALAAGAYETLYEAEGSAVERLGQSVKAFETLAQWAPSVAPLLEDLRQSRQRAEESAHALQSLAETWTSDPEALEAALARLDLISKLRKKYGATVALILERGARARAELDDLQNADTRRAELEKEEQQARQTLEKASDELSRKRQAAARAMIAAVQKPLAELGLRQAVFSCHVEPDFGENGPRLSLHGVDRVEFQWAPNPGEGARSLKSIVSGGERSRVMLALKTALAAADAVPTLVFDEIDAGVGGLTAQAVGKKLQALSRHHQILCVSHLPQIASCAEAHFYISKRTARARTFAVAERLDRDSRVQEIARMLGSALTPAGLQHAQELLAQNQ